MTTAAAPLHGPLLPIEAVPHGVVNLELVQHSNCQQTLAEQNYLMGLGLKLNCHFATLKT